MSKNLTEMTSMKQQYNEVTVIKWPQRSDRNEVTIMK